MLNLLKKAVEQYSEGKKSAFVTLISVDGSAPQISGAKMLVVDNGDRHLVFGTIGGGRLEKDATEEAITAIRECRVMKLEKNLKVDLSMACGGQVSYLIEPVVHPAKLVICGAGHVGKALADVTSDIGMSLVVVDSLTEFGNRERFPAADRIINTFDEAELERELSTDENDFIVIVSRDHATDFRLCRYFLGRNYRYLGLIASRLKSEKLKKELVEEKYSTEKIESIHSPIGLPIGGSTPGEIAISIAAQIVKVKNE